MRVKICGITNKEDALNAVHLGADAIGFIFYKNSPRYVTPEIVEEISMFLPPFVYVVGVFVNQSEDEINEISTRCKLNLIQLHGEETPNFCLKMPRRVIKAFRISEEEDIQSIVAYQGAVSAMLLDAKVKNMAGGTGRTFDWGLALKAQEYHMPLILSGGINAGNVKKAVTLVNPYAIDLSSGVESEPGIKDYSKMQELISIVKSY